MLVFTDLGQRAIDLRKAKSKEQNMCVSAVVFKPTKYKQFSRVWNRLLNRWGASAFHATDFYGGADEFRRNTPERASLHTEDSKRIPELIGSNVEKVTLIAFRPSEYLTEAPAGWLNLFGTSVHSMAVQLVLLVLGWWREEHIPSHSFDYFMESGDSDEGKVLETVKKMQLDPPTRKVIGVKTFSSIEKGSARGLEAADFWAWQWNKYYVDRVLKGTPDEPRRDFKAAVSVQKSCR